MTMAATSTAPAARPAPSPRAAMLVLPLLFLAAFLIAPMALMVAYGFYGQDSLTGMPVRDLSLQNYWLILTDELYYLSILNSIEVTVIVTVICLLIGYPIAYYVAVLAPPRWSGTLLLAIILPQWTSLLIRSFSWVAVLRPGGVVDWVLMGLGLTAQSLDLLYSRTAVIIGLVHVYLPFMILGIHASLRSLDRSLVMAARDLGASPVSAFRRVVLPLTMPGIATGIALVALPVFGAFVTPKLLGGASEVLVGNLIEVQFKELGNWPLGSALATVVSLILLLGIALLIWAGRPRA